MSSQDPQEGSGRGGTGSAKDLSISAKESISKITEFLQFASFLVLNKFLVPPRNYKNKQLGCLTFSCLEAAGRKCSL